MECSICFNQIVDKVSMTCSGQHPFCFKCLLQNVEANSELKSCPNCRGGDKFIMLTYNSNASGINGFYSLDYFKKSLPIIQKILGDSVTVNTCLISEIILIFYVKNKKQLDAAHKLMSQGESIDSVVSILKWDEKRNIEDIGIEMIGGLAEFLGFAVPTMPTAPNNRQMPYARARSSAIPERTPSDQRERRARRTPSEYTQYTDEPSRPRIIFGTGPPPPGAYLSPFGGPPPGAFPSPFGNGGGNGNGDE
jgi:hypothetical protein